MTTYNWLKDLKDLNLIKTNKSGNSKEIFLTEHGKNQIKK